MEGTGRFSAGIVETLSKRAALQCSNPECGILTTGPTTGESGAINIGEAAHIYGRTEGSARYNALMSPIERAEITNGIWLCRNCHKEIDSDQQKYSAELLFEWRREHERAVIERIGRKGDIIRARLNADRLKIFETASYLAQQIVLDKPPLWEYKLTAELLRTDLGAIYTKWLQLKRGLYVRKPAIIQFGQLKDWYSAKFDEVIKILAAFQRLISLELTNAWGEPGVPGVDTEILTVSRLIASAARNLLEWEEDVRFSHLPSEFRELQSFLEGTAGAQLDEIMRIPAELTKIFEMDNPKGLHEVELVFKLPDNFAEDFKDILQRCYTEYFKGR